MAKKKLVDFSIINDKEIFFIELHGNNPILYQGKNPLENVECVSIFIHSKNVYKGGRLHSDKSSYKTIRLATPEELEPFKSHFKF